MQDETQTPSDDIGNRSGDDDQPTLDYGLVLMMGKDGGFGMQPLPNAARTPNEFLAVGLLAMANANLQAKLTAASTMALREQQQQAKKIIGSINPLGRTR